MTDTTAIEQRQRQTPALVQHINDLAPQLARLGVDEERFTRTLLSAVQANKQLLQCTPMSFMAAAFHSAQLGLEPGPLQQVWLIPRRNKKAGTVEAQWMLGYKGMIELARRVGVIVTAGIVHANDRFAERQGSDPYLEHVPNHADPGDPILWYAVARFPDGRTIHRVLPKAEIERRRKMSSTPYKPGAPWYDHYDAMGKKTAVRALWSELPADPQLQRAAAIDEQVLTLPTVRDARPALGGASAAHSEGERGMDAQDVPTTDGETSGSSTSSEAPEQEPAADEPTAAELRDRCKTAGLPRSGSRQDLLDRLAAHAQQDDDQGETVEGEVVHEGGSEMPPPPDDPDGAPVDAEDADPDDEPPAGEWRERMIAALRGIGGQHPRYVPIWARMVDLVGDPQHLTVDEQVDRWAAADPSAVSELVEETEALAAAAKEERR